MAAVLTKAAAQVLTDAAAKLIRRLRYEGGGPNNTPLPVTEDTLLADYNRMWDALTLVKADGAYASLASGTKTAITNMGF